MRIKMLLFALIVTSVICAQDIERMGMISLSPYIPEDTEITSDARPYLLDKLSQIATISGLAGQGVDNRFVITANVRVIKKTITATIPQKTAMKISASIYIGDGIDGTLFASANKEVTGIGDSADEAYISAIRKIPVHDSALVGCVNEGKKRIIEYYDKISSSIISSATATAASGDYQGAINQLFTIPMQCTRYEEAQSRIADISRQQIENENQTLLANARTVWGASPDRNGAERAEEYLNGIQYPTPEISTGIKQLCSEISSRLSEIDNQEWNREMQEMQNRHNTEMAQIESQKQRSIAYINAAASVARTYAANRPKVVYRVYNWW